MTSKLKLSTPPPTPPLQPQAPPLPPERLVTLHEPPSLRQKVTKGAVLVIDCIGAVNEDPLAFYRSLTLAGYCITAVKALSEVSADCKKFLKQIEMTKDIMEIIFFGGPLGYFLGGKFWSDSNLSRLGNAAFLFSCGGNLLSFLDDVKLVRLSTVSNLLERVPVLGLITGTGLSLATALSAGTGIGYLCFTLAVYQKYGELSKQEGQEENARKEWWKAASLASNTALKVLLSAGIPKFVHVVLGSATAGVGIYSSIISRRNRIEVEAV
ncbi:MAG: hypothetical protein WB791_04400 [Waddliaceae bacterium]